MTDSHGPAPAPVRIGVIGCGRIAQAAHLPAIAKSESVTLVGVSDPSALLSEGVGRRYGVDAYMDTAALLARQDLDAVLVAVPDRFHRELATEALDHGLPVLLEKPAAATASEAKDLLDAAERAGRIVQVGAMRRHDPGLRFARQAVPRIGSILSAVFWYRLPSSLRSSTEAALFPAQVVDTQVRAVESGFKADREVYLLRTHGAHVFDTVRHLLGEVTSLTTECARVGDDLQWQGSIHTTAGLACYAITANSHAEYSEGIDIFGSTGQIRVRSFFPFYRKASTAAVFDESNAVWTTTEFGAVDPYQRQLEAFATAVRTGTPAEPDLYDGLRALNMIEAAGNSAAAAGARVAV